MTTTKVPDLTGTWWKSKRDGHRMQIVARVSTDRFAAHRKHRNGRTHTYSVSLSTLQSAYRPARKPPTKREESPTLDV